MRYYSIRSTVLAALAATMIAGAAPSAQAQWSKGAKFPGGALDASISFTIGNTAYFVGKSELGGHLYAFDAATDTWTELGSMPKEAGQSFAWSFSYGGRAYVGGGISGEGSVTDKVFEYDPGTDTWTERAPFGGGARDGGVAFVIGDKGYAGTGFDGVQYTWGDLWEYDFATDTWTQKSNFPGGGVIFASQFVLDGKGYVVGGAVGGSEELNSLYEYDPATDTWTQKADLPAPGRQAGFGFALNGRGYYGLGFSDYSKIYRDLWSYDPATDTWSAAEQSYPSDYTAWPAGAVVGEKVYVGTGLTWNTRTHRSLFSDQFFAFPDNSQPGSYISHNKIPFGDVLVGTTNADTVVIEPINDEGLTVSSVEFVVPALAEKHGFSLQTSKPLPARLEKGESLTAIVEFEAKSRGPFGNRILVATNDPVEPQTEIDLSATVVTSITDVIGGTSGIDAARLSLYPNPATDRMTVELALARAEDVVVRLVNERGEVVAAVCDARLEAGEHYFPVDLTSMASGVYFCEVMIDGSVATRTKGIRL